MHTINYSHKYGVLSVAIGVFTGEIMFHWTFQYLGEDHLYLILGVFLYISNR